MASLCSQGAKLLFYLSNFHTYLGVNNGKGRGEKSSFSSVHSTVVHTKVAPPFHQYRYLSSLFSYCIQNDVTSQCLSRDVGLKKPRLILLRLGPQCRQDLNVIAAFVSLFLMPFKNLTRLVTIRTTSQLIPVTIRPFIII